MANTNWDWAALVMERCSPPINPTSNNVDNFTRWMRCENPDGDWWHLNNPLNCGLNDGSADGSGSYPNLDYAATETAIVLSQNNMAPIADALRANGSLAAFSAGCAYSAWSTGGYHDNPGYVASVPQEPVIASPGSFPSPNGPTPTPSPNPTPPTPLQPLETNMIARDNVTGGIWIVRPNASVYAFASSPYIGPTAAYSALWGIGTPSNPVTGIVSDNAGGFILSTDNGGAEPGYYHITANGQYGH